MIRTEPPVFKGFSAFTRSKVLKNRLKVLTFVGSPLLTGGFILFLKDFTNLYIIRILRMLSYLKSLDNKGFQAFSQLKPNIIFYVFTILNFELYSVGNPLLTSVSESYLNKKWLKPVKVFTCNLLTCLISSAKLLRVPIFSPEYPKFKLVWGGGGSVLAECG